MEHHEHASQQEDSQNSQSSSSSGQLPDGDAWDRKLLDDPVVPLENVPPRLRQWIRDERIPNDGYMSEMYIARAAYFCARQIGTADMWYDDDEVGEMVWQMCVSEYSDLLDRVEADLAHRKRMKKGEYPGWKSDRIWG